MKHLHEVAAQAKTHFAKFLMLAGEVFRFLPHDLGSI